MALKEINLPQVNSFPLGNGATATSEYEFDAIMRLLDEYTQKYQTSVSRKTELKQSNFPFLGTLFLGIMFILLIIWLVGIVTPASPKNSLLSIIVYVILMIPMWILGMIGRTITDTIFAERRLAISAQKFLRSRLENIVRIASQMHEHSSLHYAQKLEADLRLAEAEMVLQLDRIVR